MGKYRIIGDLEGFSDEYFAKASDFKDINDFCKHVLKLGYLPEHPRETYMKKYWINVDCGDPATEDCMGYEDYQRFQVPCEVEKGERGAQKIFICEARGRGYCEDYSGYEDIWYEYKHPHKAKIKKIVKKFMKLKICRKIKLYKDYYIFQKRVYNMRKDINK